MATYTTPTKASFHVGLNMGTVSGNVVVKYVSMGRFSSVIADPANITAANAYLMRLQEAAKPLLARNVYTNKLVHTFQLDSDE